MTATPARRVALRWVLGAPLAVAAHYAGHRLTALAFPPSLSWPAALAWTGAGALFLWALVKSSWAMRLGLVVSTACLVVFLRGVNFAEMGAAFLRIRPLWLAPAVLMGFGLYIVKTYRWQILLAPVKALGFWRLFRASLMGFMANSILPARVGEFIRAGAVAIRRDVSVASVFATILVERVFDLFGVVVFFVLSLGFLRAGPDRPELATVIAAVRVGGLLITAVTASAAVFLLLLKLFPQRILAWSDRMTRLAVRIGLACVRVALAPAPSRAKQRLLAKLEVLGAHVDEKLLHLLEEFVQGLRVLTGAGPTLWIAFLSLVHWGFAIMLLYFVALCFPAVHLTVAGCMVIFVMTAVAVALPQAPGFVGVFHVAVDTGCRLLMAEAAYLAIEPDVKSFAMILWFVNIVPVVIGGFICLSYEGMSLRDLRQQGEEAAAEA